MYSFAVLRRFLSTSSARTLSFAQQRPGFCHRNLFSSSAPVNGSVKYWTPEEDQKMLELHQQGLHVHEITLQMEKRRASQIRSRLLYLRGVTSVRQGNPWKPQEDAILLEKLHAGLKMAQIAQYLPGRTRYAIQTRAWYLSPGRGGKAWTAAEKQRVIDLVNVDGQSFRDVAEALQRPLSSCYRIWAQNRERPKQTDKASIRWSATDKQRVLDMRIKDGLSLEAIAKVVGRPLGGVANIWQRYGRPNLPEDVYTGPTRVNNWSRKDDEALAALCDDGLSWHEISLRFPGKKPHTVSRRAHLLQLKGSNPRPTKVKMIAIRTALRPVLDSTATYEEVASKFEDKYQDTVARAFCKMRREFKRRGFLPSPDKRAGDGGKSS